MCLLIDFVPVPICLTICGVCACCCRQINGLRKALFPLWKTRLKWTANQSRIIAAAFQCLESIRRTLCWDRPAAWLAGTWKTWTFSLWITYILAHLNTGWCKLRRYTYGNWKCVLNSMFVCSGVAGFHHATRSYSASCWKNCFRNNTANVSPATCKRWCNANWFM